MSHTPGPWRYRQPLYDKLRGEPVRTLEVLAVNNGGIYKPYIADVRSLDAEVNDNTEANACLIAAAPDTLAALEAAYLKVPNTAANAALMGAIWAAIRKAKGDR